MSIQNRPSFSNVEKILQVQKLHKLFVNLKGIQTITVKWFDEFDIDPNGNYYFDLIVFQGSKAVFNNQFSFPYSFVLNGTNIIFARSENGVFSRFQIALRDLVLNEKSTTK